MRYISTHSPSKLTLTLVSQVDAFLEEHDSGLTDADKAVANGTTLSPTMLS